MTQTVLHFVFTAPGAGCLVQAVRKAGRDDQVIASFDDELRRSTLLIRLCAPDGLRTNSTGRVGAR
jgi:hypothetical protein